MRERVKGTRIAVVSPDAGGVERARAFAKRLDASLAIIDKRRPGPNEIAEMRIIGEVEDATAVIVDDIVDTAGTVVAAAGALRKAGARRVLAACTHAVLSGPAIERLSSPAIEELVVTDTIPLRPDAMALDKIRVVSVARLIAEAVRRTHDEESISSLFD
jgi:ribose-phosphate pyrophosphokinase